MVVMNTRDNQLQSSAFNGGAAMQQHLYKLCADSLRTYCSNTYNVKLKAAHAHELVAAYFGYASKNALLADTDFPADNLGQAKIVVMMPDTFINERRSELKGLPADLPDSYALGEWFYDPLFAGEHWRGETPPFRSYKALAKYLIERNAAYQSAFSLSRDLPTEHIVVAHEAKQEVILEVTRAHRIDDEELIGYGRATIRLPRAAGRIGFGEPKVRVETWSGGMQKRFKLVEAQS